MSRLKGDLTLPTPVLQKQPMWLQAIKADEIKKVTI